MGRNLDQLRAADAKEAVDEIKTQSNGDLEKDYRSYVSGLPANIVRSGLGQAAATELAKSDGDQGDAHYRLYRHLEEWLTCADYSAPYPQADDLIDAISSNDQADYVHAQTEALAWLKWAKKFAQAKLERR